MFVTASDFDLHPYQIPNMPVNTFPAYVSEQEKDILIKLLGSDFYTAFVNGLAALPLAWSATVPSGGYSLGNQVTYGNSIWASLVNTNLNNTPVEGVNWHKAEDNRWLKLKNGVSYRVNSKSYEWKGMVAMLKPYIVSQWVKHNFDSNSGIGITISKSENSIVISAADRIIQNWNAFARIAGSTCGHYYWTLDLFNTLFGYLYNSDALYYNDIPTDDFVDFRSYFVSYFNNPGLINLFGI